MGRKHQRKKTPIKTRGSLPTSQSPPIEHKASKQVSEPIAAPVITPRLPEVPSRTALWLLIFAAWLFASFLRLYWVEEAHSPNLVPSLNKQKKEVYQRNGEILPNTHDSYFFGSIIQKAHLGMHSANEEVVNHYEYGPITLFPVVVLDWFNGSAFNELQKAADKMYTATTGLKKLVNNTEDNATHTILKSGVGLAAKAHASLTGTHPTPHEFRQSASTSAETARQIAQDLNSLGDKAASIQAGFNQAQKHAEIAAKLPMLSVEQSMTYMPAFFGGLLAIPLVLMGRLLGSTWWGFIGASAHSYFNRTMAGYFDTDMFSVTLPALALYFFLRALCQRNLWPAVAGAVTLFIYPFFYRSGIPVAVALGIAFAGYQLVFHWREVMSWKSVVPVALAIVFMDGSWGEVIIENPTAWLLKLIAIIGSAAALHWIPVFRSDSNLPNWPVRTATGMAMVAVIFFSSPFATVRNKVYQYLPSETAAVTTKTQTTQLQYKNVISTIQEARGIDKRTWAIRISGTVVGFALTAIGYGLLVARHPQCLIALPLVGIGLFALMGGLRFTIHAVGIAALSVTWVFFAHESCRLGRTIMSGFFGGLAGAAGWLWLAWLTGNNSGGMDFLLLLAGLLAGYAALVAGNNGPGETPTHGQRAWIAIGGCGAGILMAKAVAAGLIMGKLTASFDSFSLILVLLSTLIAAVIPMSRHPRLANSLDSWTKPLTNNAQPRLLAPCLGTAVITGLVFGQLSHVPVETIYQNYQKEKQELAARNEKGPIRSLTQFQVNTLTQLEQQYGAQRNHWRDQILKGELDPDQFGSLAQYLPQPGMLGGEFSVFLKEVRTNPKFKELLTESRMADAQKDLATIASQPLGVEGLILGMLIGLAGAWTARGGKHLVVIVIACGATFLGLFILLTMKCGFIDLHLGGVLTAQGFLLILMTLGLSVILAGALRWPATGVGHIGRATLAAAAAGGLGWQLLGTTLGNPLLPLLPLLGLWAGWFVARAVPRDQQMLAPLFAGITVMGMIFIAQLATMNSASSLMGNMTNALEKNSLWLWALAGGLFAALAAVITRPGKRPQMPITVTGGAGIVMACLLVALLIDSQQIMGSLLPNSKITNAEQFRTKLIQRREVYEQRMQGILNDEQKNIYANKLADLRKKYEQRKEAILGDNQMRIYNDFWRNSSSLLTLTEKQQALLSTKRGKTAEELRTLSPARNTSRAVILLDNLGLWLLGAMIGLLSWWITSERRNPNLMWLAAVIATCGALVATAFTEKWGALYGALAFGIVFDIHGLKQELISESFKSVVNDFVFWAQSPGTTWLLISGLTGGILPMALVNSGYFRKMAAGLAAGTGAGVLWALLAHAVDQPMALALWPVGALAGGAVALTGKDNDGWPAPSIAVVTALLGMTAGLSTLNWQWSQLGLLFSPGALAGLGTAGLMPALCRKQTHAIAAKEWNATGALRHSLDLQAIAGGLMAALAGAWVFVWVALLLGKPITFLMWPLGGLIGFAVARNGEGFSANFRPLLAAGLASVAGLAATALTPGNDFANVWLLIGVVTAGLVTLAFSEESLPGRTVIAGLSAALLGGLAWGWLAREMNVTGKPGVEPLTFGPWIIGALAGLAVAWAAREKRGWLPPVTATFSALAGVAAGILVMGTYGGQSPEVLGRALSSWSQFNNPTLMLGVLTLLGVMTAAGIALLRERVDGSLLTGWGMATVGAVGLLVPHAIHARQQARAIEPVLFSPSVDLLEVMEKQSKPGDHMITWWDYGTAGWYHGNCNVMIHPGRQTDDIWVAARILSSTSQREAANLGRLAIEGYTQRGSLAVRHIFKDQLTKEEDADNDGLDDWSALPPISNKGTEGLLAKLSLPLPGTGTNQPPGPTYQPPKASRNIFLYLPTRLLPIYPVIRQFSQRDLMPAGKEFELALLMQPPDNSEASDPKTKQAVMNLLRQAAEKGHAAAQVNLAHRYQDAYRKKLPPPLANLPNAARDGNATALRNLQSLYTQNASKGLASDITAAHQWACRAACALQKEVRNGNKRTSDGNDFSVENPESQLEQAKALRDQIAMYLPAHISQSHQANAALFKPRGAEHAMQLFEPTSVQPFDPGNQPPLLQLRDRYVVDSTDLRLFENTEYARYSRFPGGVSLSVKRLIQGMTQIGQIISILRDPKQQRIDAQLIGNQVLQAISMIHPGVRLGSKEQQLLLQAINTKNPAPVANFAAEAAQVHFKQARAWASSLPASEQARHRNGPQFWAAQTRDGRVFAGEINKISTESLTILDWIPVKPAGESKAPTFRKQAVNIPWIEITRLFRPVGWLNRTINVFRTKGNRPDGLHQLQSGAVVRGRLAHSRNIGAETVHQNSRHYLVISQEFGAAFLMDRDVFNSNLVQLLLMGAHDKKHFEMIYYNEQGRLYRFKR